MPGKTGKIELDNNALWGSSQLQAHGLVDYPEVAFIERQRLAKFIAADAT